MLLLASKTTGFYIWSRLEPKGKKMALILGANHEEEFIRLEAIKNHFYASI